MKALLIHVPHRVPRPLGSDAWFIMIMPLGLMAIADHLDRNGVKTEILHLGIETMADPEFDLAKAVEESGAEVVGFSLHWHYQLSGVLTAVRNIRKRLGEKVHLCAGGLTASVFPSELMRLENAFDSIICGEGEEPLLRLCNAVERNIHLSTVPNLAWKDGDSINLNPLTFVASSEDLNRLNFFRLDLMRHGDWYTTRWAFYGERDKPGPVRKEDKSLFLPVGRGCVLNCVDCGGSRDVFKKCFGRQTVSLMDPLRVVECIEEGLKNGYSDFTVLFNPPLLSQENEYYPEVFGLLEKSELFPSIQFFCWFSLPGEKTIRSFSSSVDLKRSCLWFGVISFSRNSRRLHGSVRYLNEDLVNKIKLAKSLGIKVGLVWQLSPLDGEEEFWCGLLFVVDLHVRLGIPVTGTLNEIDPASRFWNEGEKFGLQVHRKNFKDLLARHAQSGVGERAFVEDVGYQFEDGKFRWLLVQGIFNPMEEALRYVQTGEGTLARPVIEVDALELETLTDDVFSCPSDWVVRNVKTLDQAGWVARFLSLKKEVASLSFLDFDLKPPCENGIPRGKQTDSLVKRKNARLIF